MDDYDENGHKREYLHFAILPMARPSIQNGILFWIFSLCMAL
jgi:hypothetical protein